MNSDKNDRHQIITTNDGQQLIIPPSFYRVFSRVTPPLQSLRARSSVRVRSEVLFATQFGKYPIFHIDTYVIRGLLQRGNFAGLFSEMATAMEGMVMSKQLLISKANCIIWFVVEACLFSNGNPSKVPCPAGSLFALRGPNIFRRALICPADPWFVLLTLIRPATHWLVPRGPDLSRGL